MKLSLKTPVRFRPRNPRAAVLIEGTLLLPNDSVAGVAVKNISTAGFMGETTAMVAVGAKNGIALAGCGILPAVVRWNEAGEIGAQFLASFNLDQIRLATDQDVEAQALFHSRIVSGPL